MLLGPVAIFWDYENCSPHHSAGSTVVDNIRQIAHNYGTVKLFKAYLELSEQTSLKSLGLRSELQSCGVSLTDCPHNGRKDVADKMMIVDMLTYAIDTPAPATIILISGDRDFVYAVSVPRFRRYHVVVIAPGSAHGSLKSRASEILDWDHDVLGKPLRESHARHVSADVSSARGAGMECDNGATRRANRRHSFRDSLHNLPSVRAGEARSPARPPFEDSDAFANTLRVPVQGSLPSSPHQRTHTLQSDASGSGARDSIGEGGVPTDGNAVQTEAKPANATLISPISPGIRTFGVFSELQQGPSTPCDNGPDDSSEHEKIGGLTAQVPIGQKATAFTSAADKLRSNFVGDISRSAPLPPPTASVVSRPTDFLHPDVRANTDTPTAPIDAETLCDSRTFVAEGGPQRGASFDPRGSATNSRARTGTAGVGCSPPPSIGVPVIAPQGLPPGQQFQPLIDILDSARRAGQAPILRSQVALLLVARNERVYQDAGTTRFREYAALAQQYGIVELGGMGGQAWIALLPPWQGRGRRSSSC